MSPPVFLDANIPIYAAGQPHPLKKSCVQILMLAARQPQAFLTDAEVLQELLHRYLALRLWPRAKWVFQHFATLMRERVEPVLVDDVELAASLADRHPGLSARDLLHAAVMARVGAWLIVSADAGFDHLPDIERLDPAVFSAWRDRVVEQA